MVNGEWRGFRVRGSGRRGCANGEWGMGNKIGVGVGIAIGIVFPLLATGNLDISLLITVGGLAIPILIATPTPNGLRGEKALCCSRRSRRTRRN